MANRKNTFLLKRSNVAGKVPAAGDLQLGELAINTADAILYASGTTTNSILPIGWDRVARTGDTMTGTLYVPTVSATTISATVISLNTNYSGTTAVGSMTWNPDFGAPQVGLIGGNVVQKIGETIFSYVRNNEATTLNKGEVVYIFGATGDKISVKRASNTGDTSSLSTLGVVAESIVSGGLGYVITQGTLDGLNLDSYTAGDTLWLAETPGQLTNVKQYAPNHTVYIGVVQRANAGNGQLYVLPQNGYELEELHNVMTTGATYGDLLIFSAYNGYNVWTNTKTLNGSYTITGDTTVGGQLKATSVSATTYSNLPTNTFQQVYTASTTPLITTNNTQNGLCIKNGGISNGDAMLYIQDNTNTINIELRADGTINAKNYLNLPKDVYITGGTFNNTTGVLYLTNNTGYTFDVTGFSVGGSGSVFTGGTVTGPTNFTNGLSANTISATTYYNLPTDLYITGGTISYTGANGSILFTNNTGATFNVTGLVNETITGGTYSNGVTTFTSNTGGTFNVAGTTNYSAGVISGATYTSTGTGQINLPAVKVALYNNANNIEPIIVYDIASGTTGVGDIPVLTDNDTNYIVIEYNGGAPRYNVYDNDGVVNDSSIVLYMVVYRLGNFVHTLEFGNQGAGLANKLNDRFIMTDRFGYESGLGLSLSASTGIVMVSAGVAWNGPNRQSLTAVNSSGSTFFKNYHVGGSWTADTSGDYINNTYYDNGTDIVTATAGKYLVNWYFRGQETNSHIYEVYSESQYDTVALAQLATEPALPELITSHAFLVGRIIVGVGATTGLTEGAFVNTFQSTNVTSHNDLVGIQGGTAGQYYHLTSAQYNNLALTNTNNYFSVGQTISGNLTVTGGTQILFSGNSSSDLVRIIQTGSGNAFVVEDSENDTSKFIIDNSGNVGIGITPNVNYKSIIYTNSSAQTVSLYVQNQSSNAFSVGTAIYGYGLSQGVFGYANGNSDPIGVYGYAEDGNTVIGIVGAAGISEFGSADITIGGKFDASQAGYGPGLNAYSVQLIDGTEGVGKVLLSKTADGKANWSSSLTGLTTVEATTVSATTLIGDGSQITNLPTNSNFNYGLVNAMINFTFLT
jgi:hypothetical protein